MARRICLPTFSDARGNLTVIEKSIPFDIRRIFFIYGVNDSVRGGHRHRKTMQAALCIQGSCIISSHDGKNRENFTMNAPDTGLILEPEDWHTMHHFTRDAILMVLASEYYDPTDYIMDDYP